MVNSHGGARLGIFLEHICPSKEKKNKKSGAQKMFEEREQTPLLLRKMILGAQPRVIFI